MSLSAHKPPYISVLAPFAESKAGMSVYSLVLGKLCESQPRVLLAGATAGDVGARHWRQGSCGIFFLTVMLKSSFLGEKSHVFSRPKFTH